MEIYCKLSNHITERLNKMVIEYKECTRLNEIIIIHNKNIKYLNLYYEICYELEDIGILTHNQKEMLEEQVINTKLYLNEILQIEIGKKQA